MKSKNFLNNSKSFFFSLHIQEFSGWVKYLFGKYILQRFEKRLCNQSIGSSIHSSEEQLRFWTIAKRLFYSATSKISWFFFFCSSEAFLVLTINRKFNRRVNFTLKRQKSWSDLLMDNMLGKMVIVTTEQKSCTHLLICGSHCICSSVFVLFCMYQFSFPEVL